METTRSDTSVPVLEVRDLAISYETRKGDIPAVRGVNFTIREGETIGVVGESGCGKSTIAFGILDFLGSNGKVVGGSIKFKGKELVGLNKKELRAIRGNQISIVYQDPMQALNPSLTIGTQLAEVLTTHHDISREEAETRCIKMLDRVYMPDSENVMKRYPHMISGGQQQRVVIAMAMLNNPSLLIMDEPTTALDVTVESAVLDLIEDLKKDFNTGIIFITHNLGVVARVSNRICVMYAGEMVETGLTTDIFANPAHPYTRGLLCCIPRLTDDLTYSSLWSIRGRVPHPSERKHDSCIFAPRCGWLDRAREGQAYPELADQCPSVHPDLVDLGQGHKTRCFLGAEPLKVPWNDYVRGKRKTLSRSNETAETQEVEVETLLDVQDMKVYYDHHTGTIKEALGFGEKRYVKAVDGISMEIKKGSTFGIVGESGCGKSTLVKGLLGLEQVTSGEASLMGIDITNTVSGRTREVIKELQMVFQNPDSTLNPSFTVGRQIARPMKKFGTFPAHEVKARAKELLRSVKLDEYYFDRLPRQLSGGEKQRVGIARALAIQPSMVICDEPVSALDVSVQAAVLNLLNEIKNERNTTLIFIAHDLSVVRFISDYIAVMYLGQIVEFGPVESIYPPPYHPYTEALLASVPVPDPTAKRKPNRLSGDVPSALNQPSGCHFHTRCPRRGHLPDGGAICAQEEPPKRKMDNGHYIMCHIPVEELTELAEADA